MTTRAPKPPTRAQLMDTYNVLIAEVHIDYGDLAGAGEIVRFNLDSEIEWKKLKTYAEKKSWTGLSMKWFVFTNNMSINWVRLVNFERTLR